MKTIFSRRGTIFDQVDVYNLDKITGKNVIIFDVNNRNSRNAERRTTSRVHSEVGDVEWKLEIYLHIYIYIYIYINYLKG